VFRKEKDGLKLLSGEETLLRTPSQCWVRFYNKVIYGGESLEKGDLGGKGGGSLVGLTFIVDCKKKGRESKHGAPSEQSPYRFN